MVSLTSTAILNIATNTSEESIRIIITEPTGRKFVEYEYVTNAIVIKWCSRNSLKSLLFLWNPIVKTASNVWYASLMTYKSSKNLGIGWHGKLM